MGSIKAALLDNLQHKLHPARNFMISGFALGVGAASFFLLSLMIFITNWEPSSSSLLFGPVILGISAFSPNSSLVSWSSSCDTNGTLLGNFTYKIENRMTGNKTHVGNEVENKTHFGNLELKVKNVSFHRADARVDYNCSIDYVRAPFLVRKSTFPGKNGPFSTLRLDLMDETTKMYYDAHVLVFNTGHWWTHEKTSRGEDYYQEGNHVFHRLKVLEAYRRALTTWGKWVDRNIDGNRTLVFFRGYSITHFRGGQWNSGGQCHKETEPILNETYLANYPSKMIALEQVLNQMKTPVIYLNISRLTDYRKDAHPSIYRKSYKTTKELIEAEKSQDCSHWCLPGVPDIWNELFYASLLKAGWGSPFLPK
ncbi:hypothetical protein Cgig2_024609 [Carnegiea gigantea]|uniref:Trichome birefringence-like C-terminal domain-containing protein n=1 Tax=Carnegiea gigantea TaxID=171969 RepID=A0A9Q1K8V8_9CARY|nr:hypothetical protein Cgig2_024609 [Carnegiea gigantea]